MGELRPQAPLGREIGIREAAQWKPACVATMAQMLLFSDPRPLVDRLGLDFFRNAPESPGVYVMRDNAGAVLYVGKAKNLRKRLANYRVANPDRMPRRHLRMLRLVERIELQACPSEAAALAREAGLLINLRPRFNRAGTWPGTPRFLAWMVARNTLILEVTSNPEPDWCRSGPIGLTAVPLRAALARLVWCACFPERGIAGLPEGWFGGRYGSRCALQVTDTRTADLQRAAELVQRVLSGHAVEFVEWIRARTAAWSHPFDLLVREADLELLNEFAGQIARRASVE